MNVVLNMQVESPYHISIKEQTEENVWIEAAKKDFQKFAPLYDKYYEAIFRFIYKRLADEELAFDITSQVFLKAMERLNQYNHKGVPFSSWLYRIARNEVYDSLKNNKAERNLNIDSVQVYNIIDELEADSLELNYKKMIKAIGELPEDELQLIEMRFFEKRAFKEIGEILEITENNAKVKLYRILEKLKNKIKNT